MSIPKSKIHVSGGIQMNTSQTAQKQEFHQPLRLKYQTVLQRAKNYLERGSTTKKRSGCSSIRIQWMIACEAECPHCGLRFRGGNHNTEHIHPISLGGVNDNHNRIQLCKNCNNARNSVMLALLGHPPFSKYYPQEWNTVERYLLWSEISIDEGLAAGARFPEVQDLFLEARFAGEMPVSGPRKAFGRLSTWDVGGQPNYVANTVHLRSWTRETTTGTIASFLQRKARSFFDVLFDYQPANGSTQTTSSSVNEEQATLEPSLDEPKEVSKVIEEPEKINGELSESEVEGIREKWRTHVLDLFLKNEGFCAVGDFWDLVSNERIDRGMSWRAFERALGVTHKAAMPSKVRQILEQMELNFLFEKTPNGYLIVESCEEE